MSSPVQLSDSQPLWFLDNLVYIHLDGEETKGAYHLGEMVGRSGDMPPLHVHHRDEEAFYVLDGELALFLPGKRIELRGGQAGLAPRGVAHAYRVESETARWLVITGPAGFERFVRASARPAERAELPPPGAPGDPAALARAAAEAGIEILGPPGTLPAQ